MQFSDLGDLPAAQTDAKPTTVDCLVSGAPVVRRFSYGQGRLSFEFRTFSAITAVRIAQLANCLEDDPMARSEYILAMSAAAALSELSVDGRVLRVPGSGAEQWLNCNHYFDFLTRLSMDQFLLIIDSYRIFRKSIDGARQQLLAVAPA